MEVFSVIEGRKVFLIGIFVQSHVSDTFHTFIERNIATISTVTLQAYGGLRVCGACHGSIFILLDRNITSDFINEAKVKGGYGKFGI
jgi:hypothetical protein